MWGIVHFKVGFWLVIACSFILFSYLNRRKIIYKVKEVYIKIRRRTGNPIRLNDSFGDDLEAGFSSRNFDIISQNDDDERSGLDDVSKDEIRQIMEQESLSFDKARLLYMERKFGQNGIAPDGTPMDPKAVTFSR